MIFASKLFTYIYFKYNNKLKLMNKIKLLREFDYRSEL